METLKNYVDWKLAHSDKTATAEGYPLVMENCKANKRMKQFEVYGDCFQETSGKNLFNINNITAYSGNSTYSVDNGVLTVSQTSTSKWQSKNIVLDENLVGQTITVSAKVKTTGANNACIRLLWFNGSTQVRGTQIRTSYYTGTDEITISATGIPTTKPEEYPNAKLCIVFYSNANATLSSTGNYSAEYREIQLEVSNAATEYEPYIPKPTPDNPSGIQSVGDLTTKNLFDKDNALVFNGYFSGTTIANYNPTVRNFATICIDCKPNTAYTISRQIQSKRFRFASSTMPPGTDTVVNIFDSYDSNMNGTITTGKDDIYLYVWFYNQTIDIDYTYQEIMNGIQIEEGSIATEYEPYHKYKIPITARGKNLLPYPYASTTKTINGVTFTDNGDGSITVNGTATANAIFYLIVSQDNYTLDKCGLKIGDRYTISKTLISGDSIANVYFTANYYDENGNMKAGASISNANTATATIKFDFVMWGIYLLVLKDKTVNNTTIKFQIEKGTSATEYEPYIEPVTQNIYLDEPLRKVGDYADYIDFKNQKIYRIIDRIELLPEDVYIPYTYGINHGFVFHALLKDSGTIRRTHYSNRSFGVTVNPTTQNLTLWLGVGGAGTRNIYWVGVSDYLHIYDASKSNDEMIAEFKEWLSQNPTYVLYPLMTPIEEDISCQLPKILAKTTIIEVDTTLLPSNIKGKYVIK